MRMQVLAVSLMSMAALSMTAFAADRFERVFAWGRVTDEASARAYAEIGVTDVTASGTNGFAAAKKFGLRAYCGFFPCGAHGQVLNAAERQHLDFLNAVDLRKQLSREELAAKVEERLRESRCQFGGEPVSALDVCPELIACFTSDAGFEKSKERMRKTLRENPLADGIAFDYIGYVNLHSCECADCKAGLAAYLKERGVAESEQTRNEFYRTALVTYINAMVDCAKATRPGLKVAIHLYPAFAPDPLYGKYLKADYIEQTVAWYFQWPDEKICDYTRRIVGEPHLPGSESMPFVGLSATPGKALAYKSPKRFEDELRLILKAGGRSVAVCNGGDLLKPGYREALMKFTAKARRP